MKRNKMKIIKYLSLIILPIYFTSCTPMKASPKEEKHQLELTLHELQTNLDDLRHDLNCFQTEMQILDGKIKHQEDSTQNIKQQHIEKIQSKFENYSKQISSIENRLNQIDTKQKAVVSDLSVISNFSNETNIALSQYKEKINELENSTAFNNKKIDEISSLKTTLLDLVKNIKTDYFLYKVKPGDSLEKISKSNKVSVDTIKKLNDLSNDLIVIGQELKIPNP